MRVIDRIFVYLHHFNLTPHSVERSCDLANGYLKKQMKGKGTIGSEILEKIGTKFRDLNLSWVLTGRGKMLFDGSYPGEVQSGNWSEDRADYIVQENTIRTLKDKIIILENALADKEKIIRLLERDLASCIKS